MATPYSPRIVWIRPVLSLYDSRMNRSPRQPLAPATPSPQGEGPHQVDGLDGIDAIVALVALADTGSLGRAAKRLRSSQPTIGRKLRVLEDQVGQALVVRQGRGLALTPAGEELVTAGREVVTSLDRFGLVAKALGRELAGQVRVSASEAVATELLPAWVAALRQSHPGLQVALVAENRASDVLHREADLAVRMFRPTDPELVAVRLGETPMALWASRAYIARRGHPRSVAALVDHDAIAFDRDTLFESAFRQVVGDLPESRIALRSDSHAASLRAILAGVGVGALQRIIAARYPDELVEVAPDAVLPALEAWLVTSRDLRRARAIRAAFDHLRDFATTLFSTPTPPLKRRRAP